MVFFAHPFTRDHNNRIFIILNTVKVTVTNHIKIRQLKNMMKLL